MNIKILQFRGKTKNFTTNQHEPHELILRYLNSGSWWK